MKKILFAVNKFAVGGAERLVVDQANHLHQSGDFFVSVAAFLPENEASIKNELLIPQEQVRFFPFRNFFDIRAYRKFIRFLRQERFDIIVTNLFFANTVVRIAALFAFLFDVKKPAVIAYEHNIYRYKNWKHFFVDRVLARATTKIIAVSESVKNFLVAQGRIPREKIIVLYNGVSISPQCVLGRDQARKKYGIPENAHLVVSVGRITEQKGYAYLIDAAALLRERGIQNAQFVIIGARERELGETLDNRVKEKKLSDAVTFTGPLPHCDVIGYLSAADIFCMPSLWEGFGIAALEAMMLGKPVVASRIDGLAEIIYDGKDGFLVSPRDAGEIASAIERLLQDPALAKQCGASGRERSAKFSFDEHIRRFEQLLADACEQK